MLYNIADLIINMHVGDRTVNNAKEYIYTGDKEPDFDIIGDSEKALSIYGYLLENPYYPMDYKLKTVDYVYERDLFAKELLKYNGLIFHSSAVAVDGKAFLFSAPSGTGKSTHTSKWLEMFGKRAIIMNDDRPAIRIIEDEIFAYGTPWCGSTDINTNIKAKLAGICFLTRDDKNWIKPINKDEIFYAMLSGCIRKMSSEEMSMQLDIIDNLISRIPIYTMGCTPTIEAAQMSYEAMNKGV